MSEDVEEEITLPGVIRGDGGAPREGAGAGAPREGLRRIGIGEGINTEAETASEDEDLEDIEETIAERLVGLTEMVPQKVWNIFGRSLRFSYWLVRRSGWVLGTSLTLLALPPFLEYQRVEFEEMRNMQKKQMLLGPSQPPMTPGPLPR